MAVGAWRGNLKVRFALDSALEETVLSELVSEPKLPALDPLRMAEGLCHTGIFPIFPTLCPPVLAIGGNRLHKSFLTGDRGFESASLQRGVTCEPRDLAHDRPARVLASGSGGSRWTPANSKPFWRPTRQSR